MVGANTLVSMWGGIPSFNPAKRLHEARQRGLKLIVVDPRRTETARKADLHLQCLPGHDPQILAAMMHVIVSEGLYDREFVADETEGFEALAAAVAPFTSERVGAAAGVPAAQIVAAARLFAGARRGNATSGTGPSMAPHGVLMDYLLLALNTICGRWVRAGEPVPNAACCSGSSRASRAPRSGARPGVRRDAAGARPHDTAAGLPTAALPDEILEPGPGQVKALIVVGGNPLTSWPNEAKTRRALESLELLVVVDPMMSSTAQLAHYVIGPRFGFETRRSPSRTKASPPTGCRSATRSPTRSTSRSWSNRPRARTCWRTGESSTNWLAPWGCRSPGAGSRSTRRTRPPPMRCSSTSCAAAGCRWPRSRRIRTARCSPTRSRWPRRARADWPFRLQLRERSDAARAAGGGSRAPARERPRPRDPCGQRRPRALELLLVSRREHATYNSVGHALPALLRRRPYNPAYLNPDDARRLGVRSAA